MRIGMALAAAGTLAAAAVATTWLTAESRRNRLVWDHFDVVKPGFLYRSGQLNADQLAEAVRRYKLRTVVNFLKPGADVEQERALARQLGVDFLHLPMPGDGFGREDQFRQVLAALDDPERRPVLVHCARGTCRTGASVALYRFERDGWTVEDVAAEMRRQTYREGWLPGFVYGMVERRPNQALFDPQVTYDRNRGAQEATDVR